MLAHPLLSCKDIVVLGVDVSLRSTGIALIDNGAVLSQTICPRTTNKADRLVFIYESVRAFSRNARVQLAAIENYAYDADGRLAELGEAGGVVRLACAQAGLTFVDVEPARLKLFATGQSAADKTAMKKAAGEHYGVKTDNDDIADAVALAFLAGVYLTNASTRRCELEVVRSLKIHARSKRTPRVRKSKAF